MPYNSGFPATYQPMYPQYQQPYMQQPYPQQQDQRAIHGFDWVIGRQGADAYTVPAGKTFILFDAAPDSHQFFIKSADPTGKPYPAAVFDYVQHKDDDKPAAVDLSGYVPLAQFEALKKEMDELKAQPMPETLTAEDVKDMFDQMMEQRFAKPEKKKVDK